MDGITGEEVQQLLRETFRPSEPRFSRLVLLVDGMWAGESFTFFFFLSLKFKLDRPQRIESFFQSDRGQ